MFRALKLSITILVAAVTLAVVLTWGFGVYMIERWPGRCSYRTRTLLDVVSPDGATRVSVSCRVPLLAFPDFVDPPVVLRVRHVDIADDRALFDSRYSLWEASDIGDLAVEWSVPGQVPVLHGIRRPVELGRIELTGAGVGR